VVLSGPLPALAAVTVDQIVATVDLQDLEAGEHSVSVQVQAPEGLALSSVTPAQVQVTLRPQ
jgi:YbbR domain-containing protein